MPKIRVHCKFCRHIFLLSLFWRFFKKSACLKSSARYKIYLPQEASDTVSANQKYLQSTFSLRRKENSNARQNSTHSCHHRRDQLGKHRSFPVRHCRMALRRSRKRPQQDNFFRSRTCGSVVYLSSVPQTRRKPGITEKRRSRRGTVSFSLSPKKRKEPRSARLLYSYIPIRRTDLARSIQTDFFQDRIPH